MILFDITLHRIKSGDVRVYPLSMFRISKSLRISQCEMKDQLFHILVFGCLLKFVPVIDYRVLNIDDRLYRNRLKDVQ